MAEYLELEKVLDDKNIITVQTREYGSIEVIPVETIVDIESADVVPALYGKWIERHDYIECSFCGFTVLDTYCEKRDCTNGDTYFNFCPRCGAYMGEPETTKG